MIQFAKLHGNGNDFILIDEYSSQIIPDPQKPDFAQQYCDRRFGIGGDGVLFLSKSSTADLRMRLFQPDRSEAEMCGNGIRCLAKFALDKGYISPGGATIETAAGIMPVEVNRRGGEVWVKVDMGKTLVLRKDIPALGEGEFINEALEGMNISAVNTGVPHAVIFVDDLDAVDINATAPAIRFHSVFPRGANVNFARACGNNEVQIRTYERGVEGETLSCGTGSVAAAVIAHRLGLAGSSVTVNTRGGRLNITIEGDHAFMEGPAKTVFSGTLV